MATELSAATASAQQQAKDDFKVTEGYRSYVVWLLFLIYVFNFVDRQILTVLIEPIKKEFMLSDTQLGLLGGLAFATLYSTLGIPIARLADASPRPNIRVNIMTASLFMWSLFTALTGRATSFAQLLAARVLVGVGEAGCSPSAYSLLADYFPPQRRATAFSIYSMGIYGGVFVGFLVGGQVAQSYGWRAAFYAVGLPGLLLSLVVKTTLREPPRGFSDTVRTASVPPRVGEVMRTLWAKPSFRHMSFAAALHSFVGYGVGGFHPAFLMRTHGLTVAEVGYSLAMISAIGGVTGTYLGGYLADRQTRKHDDLRWQLLVPGYSTLLNVPLAIAAYLLPDRFYVLLVLVPTTAIGTMYLQSLVGIRERALAGALLLFIINLIGLGFGPVLTGMLSDVLKGSLVAGGATEVAATAQGLRWALCVMVCVNAWSALHYVLATRTLRQDTATAAAAAAAV